MNIMYIHEIPTKKYLTMEFLGASIEKNETKDNKAKSNGVIRSKLVSYVSATIPHVSPTL